MPSDLKKTSGKNRPNVLLLLEFKGEASDAREGSEFIEFKKERKLARLTNIRKPVELLPLVE